MNPHRLIFECVMWTDEGEPWLKEVDTYKTCHKHQTRASYHKGARAYEVHMTAFATVNQCPWRLSQFPTKASAERHVKAAFASEDATCTVDRAQLPLPVQQIVENQLPRL